MFFRITEYSFTSPETDCKGDWGPIVVEIYVEQPRTIFRSALAWLVKEEAGWCSCERKKKTNICFSHVCVFDFTMWRVCVTNSSLETYLKPFKARPMFHQSFLAFKCSISSLFFQIKSHKMRFILSLPQSQFIPICCVQNTCSFKLLTL